MLKMQKWHGSCYMSRGLKQAHAEEVMGHAREKDSRKLMALIDQISALLEAKQERLLRRSRRMTQDCLSEVTHLIS
jgi:hypothetical protein